MDILSHHDSSVIGSFATNKYGYYINVELYEPENTKALLSTSTSEPILYLEVSDKLVFPLVVDTDFILFFAELIKEKQLPPVLPSTIEKAMLIAGNFKSKSISTRFCLFVIDTGRSEETITLDFCPKKVTLECNYFPV